MNAIVVMVVLVVAGIATATHAITPNNIVASNIIDLLKSIFVSSSKENNNPDKNIKKIIKDLKKRGYNDNTIAGILGNISVETGGTFDYTEKQDLKVKDDELGAGYGLFQMDPNGMLPHYNTYLEENNKKDSMKNQLDFMDNYVKGNITYFNEEDNADAPVLGYGNVKNIQEIFQSNDSAAIADVFAKLVENPDVNKNPKFEERQEAATKYSNEYFNN